MRDEKKRPSDERDDVATLVRLAGKRRAVPQARAERVKATARAEWQREVRQRSRRRRVWTAAALATAATVVLAITVRLLSTGTGAPVGPHGETTVLALAGAAWSRAENVEALRPLAVGDEIVAGSELGTEVGSRAAFRLASGHSVRLDASTAVRLREDGALALDRGTIYVDSGLESVGAVAVHTRLGVIREIGTQFEVRLANDSVQVRLREGSVVVDRDERSHPVQAGYELELASDGSVSRREIDTYGPAWAWLAEVTPMLDLEGHTARFFLDWVARERGWRLEFADETVARSADEIVLGGTASGLTLDQSLDAVLPTCRMTYRVEQGVLTVEAAPGS